jgi:large conductance mechanosensitive channel
LRPAANGVTLDSARQVDIALIPPTGDRNRHETGAKPKPRRVAMWKEFKTFIMRGNVLDMAVGIIIGAAFGKIVTSLVNDIIMPPIGLVLGHVDFSNFFLNLSGQHYDNLADAKKAGAVTIAYGNFLNTVIEFLIVAFAVFLLIKWVNRIMPKPPAAPPSTKECSYCKMGIPVAATRCPNCTSQLSAA